MDVLQQATREFNFYSVLLLQVARLNFIMKGEGCSVSFYFSLCFDITMSFERDNLLIINLSFIDC